MNQLAHHALATRLAPCLVAAGAQSGGPPARIVLLASAAARWPRAQAALAAALDPAAPAAPEPPWAPYAASKLANVAWCRAATGRWPRVDVVALHPGTAPSGLQRHMGATGRVLNALTTAAGCSIDRRALRRYAALVKR